MPSFLGRFLGITFRTELLIMNILGLINSTLDWSSLKWTNKLEQIWNFSMPQKSLIVDTIGEDTIKTILSWIVITRIVIAHVYTFTYLSNIYPVITWSRPNFLLPWLILSFFKNVVLEVIVIVIGLLLWYGSPFSLVVFLEFIFVKLVPLILASYNWYSNSCLFLQLRQTEKMKKLHRSMRSDSNLLTNQLYVKIDDPKYRTGSLTTLFSYDSYETYHPNLTPGENAKKLLGITDQDIEDARAKVKERQASRRLTELDDEIHFGEGSASKAYFFGSNICQSDMFLHKISDISTMYPKSVTIPKDLECANNYDKPDTSESPKSNPETIQEEHYPVTSYPGTDQSPQKNNDEQAVEFRKVLSDSVTFDDLEKIEEEDAMLENVARDVLVTKKRESTELIESQKTKHPRTRSPTHEENKTVERSSSPVPLQALLHCSCSLADSASKESHANSAKTTNLRTSTPKERSDDDIEDNSKTAENSKTTFDQPYTYVYNVTDVKTDFTMNSGLPLMEKLLKNNLEILRSINMDERSSEKNAFDDLPVRNVLKIQEDRSNILLDGYGSHRNPSVDVQNVSEIRQDLDVSTKMSTLKSKECGSDRRKTGNASAEDGTDCLHDAVLRPHAWCTEENVAKLNLRECPPKSSDMPGFYKDFMKVFDGFYQNDFANNSELQCALQQMEKKKWNLFSGQTNIETLMTTAFPERNPPSSIDSWRPEETYDSSGSTSRRSVLTEDSQSPKIDASSRLPETPSKVVDRKTVVNAKKDVGTQTAYYPIPVKSNFNEASRLIDTKSRGQYYRKRKRPQDQRESVSQVTSAKPAFTKKDASSLFSRMRSKPPLLPKSASNDSRGLKPSRSFSNKNDCECGAQKLGGKYSPSTDSSFDKRENKCNIYAKQKVDSLATLPLAQAIRRSEALHPRKKPPACSKETKKDTLWSTPGGRKAEPVESKKSVDRLSTRSSRTNKSWNKNRRPTDEQTARELRALKAYNEITLLEDKKKLEIKKNLGKVAPNRDFRSSSYRKNTSKNDLGKENQSTNAANVTGSSFRSNKSPLNAADKSISVPNEKHVSKSSRVTKAAEREKNFDRLYESKDVGNDGREMVNADLADIRRMIEEIVPLEASYAKLGSAEPGRDLYRTRAKEAVSDAASRASSVEVDVGRLGSGIEEPAVRDTDRDEASRADVEDLEPGNKELLAPPKKSAKEDAASTWSSSSGELKMMPTGNTQAEQVEDLPRVEEVLEDESDGTARNVEELVTEEKIQQREKTLEDTGSERRDQEDNQGNSILPVNTAWREPDRSADNLDIDDIVIPTMPHDDPYYSHNLLDPLLTDGSADTLDIEDIVIPMTPHDDPYYSHNLLDPLLTDRSADNLDIEDIVIPMTPHDDPYYSHNLLDPLLTDGSADNLDIEDIAIPMMSHDDIYYFHNLLDPLLTDSTPPVRSAWREPDRSADNLDIDDSVSPVMPHDDSDDSDLTDPILVHEKREEVSRFVERVGLSRWIVPVVREGRGLNPAPKPFMICAADMDRESFPGNLEPEGGIDEIEVDQELRSNDKNLNDILSIVTEVLKNLNIDENAENLSGTSATMLKTVKISDHEPEDGSKGEALPKFIEEDIFTNIKIPIKIRAAELCPGLKTLNVLPLQLSLDRDAELVEPIGSEFEALTVITEGSEENAAQTEARGLQDSNLEKSTLKFASSRKVFETMRADEFDVDIGENHESAVDETVTHSLDYDSIVESPTTAPDFVGDTPEADLNKTYDIVSGCSTEATGEKSVTIVEIDDVAGEDNVCDGGRIQEAESIETKKIGEVSTLEADQRGMMDAGLEEITVKLKESVKIAVSECVDVGRTEELVQDEQVEDRHIEVAEIENPEFHKNSVDENTTEETVIRVFKERNWAEKVRDSFQSEETTSQRVEEARDTDYQNVTVVKNQDSERVRRFDKYEQEENIGNEALEEGVSVEEAEDSSRDVDVISNIEIDRPSTSIAEFKKGEENVPVLDPVWDPNILADCEKKEDVAHKDTDRAIGKKEEVSTPEIAQEETEVAEASEQVSLKMILVFWVLVFYFYVRYFYRKIWSFTQVSRATSALRPFEVHTVSTSTSTLIEKIELEDEVQEEPVAEEGEETFETSLDYATMNISRVIEEQLRVVVDLTTDRSVSRNSEFGTEEMAEELRRETIDLGLSSNEYLVDETRFVESEGGETSPELETQQDVIQAARLQESSPENNDKKLDILGTIVKIEAEIVEVYNVIRKLEASLSTDNSYVEGSPREGTSEMDKVSDSREKTDDSSPTQFDSNLEDMDSFCSLYTRPSVTTDTISYTGLEGDDMEEFSNVSNTSDEPAQT